MARSYVAEAEAILDKEYEVLDKGFVRLVDYMGGDDRIVQAARVSYGAGTKSYREDKGLINYLLRNEHTSPFEQVVLTFHVKLPIFVARQWVRHRTARLNEISGRYSIMKNEFYLPNFDDISFQSKDNKQGRATEELSAELKERVYNILRDGQNKIFEDYQDLIDENIARELARINLPLSTYTEWFWQIDLHNLFHFLKLRLDPHAQKEIRDYSEVMLEIVKKVAPIATEAFETQIKGSCRLASYEIEAVKALIEGKASPLEGRNKEILFEKLGLKLE